MQAPLRIECALERMRKRCNALRDAYERSTE